MNPIQNYQRAAVLVLSLSMVEKYHTRFFAIGPAVYGFTRIVVGQRTAGYHQIVPLGYYHVQHYLLLLHRTRESKTCPLRSRATIGTPRTHPSFAKYLLCKLPS